MLLFFFLLHLGTQHGVDIYSLRTTKCSMAALARSSSALFLFDSQCSSRRCANFCWKPLQFVTNRMHTFPNKVFSAEVLFKSSFCYFDQVAAYRGEESHVLPMSRRCSRF